MDEMAPKIGRHDPRLIVDKLEGLFHGWIELSG